VPPNKLLVSDDAKPEGMLVVEPGTEAFLHPHPVGRLWGRQKT